jgi:hypothetical protein
VLERFENQGSAYLDELREIVAARVALGAAETELVARARLAGVTWTEIGGALGMTRQGARKRHTDARRLERAEPFVPVKMEP